MMRPKPNLPKMHQGSSGTCRISRIGRFSLDYLEREKQKLENGVGDKSGFMICGSFLRLPCRSRLVQQCSRFVSLVRPL